MRTDGQTVVTKLIVAIRSFANASINECNYNSAASACPHCTMTLTRATSALTGVYALDKSCLFSWPGRGVDHPPPSSAEVKERVELYIYSTYGPSWPILGWNLIILTFQFTHSSRNTKPRFLPLTLSKLCNVPHLPHLLYFDSSHRLYLVQCYEKIE